jgi:hypothetical protein
MRVLPSQMSIFLTIGNHDVQNCHDLNTQLNYYRKDPRYQMLGMYYNVIYKLEGFSVNFILIDTNMYTEEYTCDGRRSIRRSNRMRRESGLEMLFEKVVVTSIS